MTLVRAPFHTDTSFVLFDVWTHLCVTEMNSHGQCDVGSMMLCGLGTFGPVLALLLLGKQHSH